MKKNCDVTSRLSTRHQVPVKICIDPMFYPLRLINSTNTYLAHLSNLFGGFDVIRRRYISILCLVKLSNWFRRYLYSSRRKIQSQWVIAVYENFTIYSLVNTDYPVWVKAKRYKEMLDAPRIKTVPVPLDVPVLYA